jgi:hypothetical protein
MIAIIGTAAKWPLFRARGGYDACNKIYSMTADYIFSAHVTQTVCQTF